MTADQVGSASEWFEKGEHDLAGAKLLLQHGGFTDTVAVLIQQGVEKYIKGYLIAQGWRLRKTHDLELLIGEAAKCDHRFGELLDLVRTLSAFYVEWRYPSGRPAEYSAEEMGSLIRQADELVALIRGNK